MDESSKQYFFENFVNLKELLKSMKDLMTRASTGVEIFIRIVQKISLLQQKLSKGKIY